MNPSRFFFFFSIYSPQLLGRTRKTHKDDMFALQLPDGASMYYLDLIISSPVDREVSIERFPSPGTLPRLPMF